MKRRVFGSIYQRAPRPGDYVAFHWGGRRIRRSAGLTKAAASTAAPALRSDGQDGQLRRHGPSRVRRR